MFIELIHQQALLMAITAALGVAEQLAELHGSSLVLGRP
jgi:hypothetical protein